MPKGGLLHSHLDATVDTRYLLNLGLNQRAMHVRAIKRVTASNLQSVLPEFLALPEHMYSKDKNGLTHEKYVPNSWIQLRIARETFDASLGGPTGFDDWVNSALTIDPSEAYGTHNTVTKAWFLTSSYDDY